MICRSLPALLAGLLLLSVGGCRNDRPELTPVSGRVTRNGGPVVGARVYFKPSGLPGAAGMTDEQGRYELTFAGEHAGTPPGKTTISVYASPPASDPRVQGEGLLLIHQETRMVDAETREINLAL